MRLVAKWLVRAFAASAQPCALDPRHGSSGATENLEIATQLKRPVDLGFNGKRAVAYGKGGGFLRGWFARRDKSDIGMRLVAERLSFRSAAAAQRGAKSRRCAVDRHVGANGIG